MQALATAQLRVASFGIACAPVYAGCWFAAVVLAFTGAPVYAAMVVSLGFAFDAATTDVVSRRLPNALVALTAAAPVAGVLAFAAIGDLAMLGGVAAGALLGGAPVIVLHVVNPAAMGFGDVKFAAALGANLGLVDARLALVGLCLASLLGVGWAVATRRSALPFGPPLLAGATIALVLSAFVERVA